MNRVSSFAALALILIHFTVSMVHGAAHQAATVTLNTFGYTYVLIVITLAPLVAGVLLFPRQQKVGALVLALSMFGSFIFGFWYHFLSATTDNVSQVHGPWHDMFLWTAIGLAVIELAGGVTGLKLYRRTATS